jgi:hypothetical protein
MWKVKNDLKRGRSLLLTGFIIVAVALPPLLVFGLRGLPRTDRPPLADFDVSRPESICCYRQCSRQSVGTFDVRVTTGTDSRFNKTIILVDTRNYPLCADHARYAERGQWPMHGWRFVATFIAALVFCGFLSVCLLGVGFVVLLKKGR